MKIRKATLSERPEIVRIGKQSKYTKGVSNPMFMSVDSTTFDRGEVAVAVSRKGHIRGFVVVRHLVRRPVTSLHYVGVDDERRSRGLGEELVRWALKTSPHGVVRLLCEVENERAHGFYRRLGFEVIAEGANKSGEPWLEFYVTKETWLGRPIN